MSMLFCTRMLSMRFSATISEFLEDWRDNFREGLLGTEGCFLVFSFLSVVVGDTAVCSTTSTAPSSESTRGELNPGGSSNKFS